MNPSSHENPSKEPIKPDIELPHWIVKSFGDLALAKAVIADESGKLPPVAKKRQFESQINSIAQSIREAREKAVKSGSFDQIAEHTMAVTSTIELMRSFDMRSLGINPDSKYSEIVARDSLESVKHSSAGILPGKLRSGIDKIFARRYVGKKKTAEIQIVTDRIMTLKIIGLLANFEDRIREIVTSDETGEITHVIESHQPESIRKHIGELAVTRKIDESSPLHPRWSEQQNPKNIQELRNFLIKTSNKNITGEDPANMAKHIRSSGINGSVRPQIIASYLGVTFRQWDTQRYGQTYAGPGKIPTEVIDQINFLIKLDSEVVGYYDTDTDNDVPLTALDILIKYGAGQPWSEISSPTQRKRLINRIKRVKERRLNIRTQSKGTWLPIELIDSNGKKITAEFYIPFGKDPNPIIQKQIRQKGYSLSNSK
jgi:hypothetical protein